MLIFHCIDFQMMEVLHIVDLLLQLQVCLLKVLNFLFIVVLQVVLKLRNDTSKVLNQLILMIDIILRTLLHLAELLGDYSADLLCVCFSCLYAPQHLIAILQN